MDDLDGVMHEKSSAFASISCPPNKQYVYSGKPPPQVMEGRQVYKADYGRQRSVYIF